jgi:hypothetical protein
VYCYFSEDTTYALLFREMASVSEWNLMKIVRDILEKNHHFAFWDTSEETLFFKLQCSYSLDVDP